LTVDSVQSYRTLLQEIIRSLSLDISNASGSALAFSGGVDSSLLLWLSRGGLRPYTTGFPGSPDLKSASTAAALMGFSTVDILLDDQYTKNAASAIRKIDPGIPTAELGYEIVLYAILDHAPVERLVTGQGADELFYGYRAFIDNPLMSNERHLKDLFEVTLPRETRMAEEFSKTLLTPYLSPRILEISRSLGRDRNVIGSRNKSPLRDAAIAAGLPEEIAERPKKAAQYGTLVQKRLRAILRH
jgi:asparagine synthase (glutamine-hydrolysing)